MKSALNALAVIFWLLWAAWLFLDELGRGFGGASAPTYGEVGFAVVLVVFLAVLGSVIASRFADGPRAWTLAVLPFVFVLLGHGFLVARRSAALRERQAEDEERAREVQARFDEIPADFRYRGAFAIDDPRVASILVIDPETGSLAEVAQERQSIVTYCLGALEGETLTLSGEPDLHDFVDASGATVYDRFTVRTDPAAAPADCDYERYDF
jgi:hypothetical protein